MTSRAPGLSGQVLVLPLPRRRGWQRLLPARPHARPPAASASASASSRAAVPRAPARSERSRRVHAGRAERQPGLGWALEPGGAGECRARGAGHLCTPRVCGAQPVPLSRARAGGRAQVLSLAVLPGAPRGKGRLTLPWEDGGVAPSSFLFPNRLPGPRILVGL